MNTSSSALADALITILSAGSVIGPGVTSKSGYQLLESAASAAAIVKWRSLDTKQSSYGQWTDTWGMEIKCFIRDTGDPFLATNRVWTVTDRVIATLKSNDTLQGTCDYLASISGNQDPEQALTINGATWLPFSIQIQAVGL